MNTAYTLGRILLPILFIWLGVQNILNADDLARTLAGYVSLPADIEPYLGGLSRYVALAYLVGAVEVVCAAMVLVGLKARWAALVLIVYAASTVIFTHNFWEMEGAAAASNRLQALMYLSVIGGLLLVVACGSGPSALDRRA
jgi:putative oxidoreductase